MTELSQTLTTDYRTPQGDYQRIQYIPVSQSTSGLQQPQHIQLQVVQVAPVLYHIYFSFLSWTPYCQLANMAAEVSKSIRFSELERDPTYVSACKLWVKGICKTSTPQAVKGSGCSSRRDFCLEKSRDFRFQHLLSSCATATQCYDANSF